MDPTDLTCPKCGTAWKVIKAADGPVTCPNCKAPVSAPAAATPTPAPAAEPAPPPPPVEASPSPAPARPAVRHLPDSGDRELRRDYADSGGPRFPSGRRRHPLLVVLTVLLILFVLLPVAGIVLLFAVCAWSSR
jgi:hypothetical protein